MGAWPHRFLALGQTINPPPHRTKGGGGGTGGLICGLGSALGPPFLTTKETPTRGVGHAERWWRGQACAEQVDTRAAAARGARYFSIRLTASALPMPRTFPVKGFT